VSGPVRLDPRGKVGRALFQLVDATMKMNSDVRTRVARVRNMVESHPGDPDVAGKVESDLGYLMRDPKLNAQVRLLRKALRTG
jgi:hypothetical protein